MAKQKSVFDLLEAWGEWERCGSNVLRHLQTKSSMQSWMDSVLPSQRGFAPGMSDDEALAFGQVMLKLKTLRRASFEVLYMVHVDRASMRDVASRLNVSRESAARIYERAIGWLEGCFEFVDNSIFLDAA